MTTCLLMTDLSDTTVGLTKEYSGMNPCLLIPEIQKHIFLDIYLSGTEGGLRHYWKDRAIPSFVSHDGRRVARRSLAALSRVCRHFKDIALDVLWAELETLDPLFTCLPGGLWTMDEDGNIAMQRPVTIADWPVFEQYACRVRVLGHKNSNLFGRVDAEFIHAIMAFSSKSLLVPNLRALCCGRCPLNLHPCMRYLLGPHLVDLRLLSKSDFFWTNLMSSVLSSLSRYSPRLETMVVHATSLQGSELVLYGLPLLRNVSLTQITDETLSYLSHLTDLEELDIKIPVNLGSIKLQFRTNLSKLIIRVRTLTSSVNILEGWDVTCRVLHLISDVPETALAIEHALRRLNNQVLFDGLEGIQMHAPKNDDRIDYAFYLDTFTPLMHFSGLKAVELAAFCMSWLDDDTLGSIVKSWPCLENLCLGTRYFWRTRPRITFQGLVTVLSSCPNLRVLGLVFDATKLGPPTPEKPGGGVCNTNVTSLHVGFSPIEQPMQVAVALSAILPCLTEISVEEKIQWSTDREARADKWGEVLTCIGVYTMIRKQEGLRL
ncbi:hypothetical protein K503DRAFT_129776 [Rhizopogon vinicolor AM-OR11-026]|uniref:F-box domain-containing protein n=1 Tax=Rhizopogon vinicolor AM-OR11-026 TaxID=1314800 RepID=A0A1B7N1X3_9AGAM|nr:hypothetical protein K503DRAFT_129776 [Rhizopogon vinicolor AM-OR11-026]